MEVLERLLNISLVIATIRTTAPILLVALGGSFTTKAGIFNIGLEGQMLVGAFFVVAASDAAQNASVEFELAKEPALPSLTAAQRREPRHRQRYCAPQLARQGRLTRRHNPPGIIARTPPPGTRPRRDARFAAMPGGAPGA